MNQVDDNYFSPEFITKVFEEKIFYSKSRGIDCLSPKKFKQLFPNYAEKISHDIRTGSYVYSPYLEKLILKGKGKCPRVISIPSIRDKIVLTCINYFLQKIFPLCVKKEKPNNFIKDIYTNIGVVSENGK